MSATSFPGQPHAAQADRYDPAIRGLHWVVVALVLAQYTTELIPKSLVDEDTLGAWHLAIGPTILLLMLLRLVWRLTHRMPPPPADLSPGLRTLSRLTHWAFYAILIVLPVLGWISASGFGARPQVLGFVPLPLLIAPNKATAESVGGVHGFLAWTLLFVIGLHVAGALYHRFVKRDAVLARILPGG